MISRFFEWLYEARHADTDSHPGVPYTDDDTPEPRKLPDGLDKFNELIGEEGVKIKQLLNEWREHEKALIAIDIPHPDHDHEKACEVELDNRKSIIRAFFEKVKACFQSAKSELTEENKRELEDHVDKIVAHINELCERAQDESLSDDERIGVLIHICNASIVVLEELDKLLTDFSNEIGYCLRSEAHTEQVAQLLMNAALYFLQTTTGVILPPVNIDFREQYREFLNEEIEQPREQVLMGVTDAEGELMKAEKLVETDIGALRVSQTGVFSGKPEIVIESQGLNESDRLSIKMH